MTLYLHLEATATALGFDSAVNVVVGRVGLVRPNGELVHTGRDAHISFGD